MSKSRLGLLFQKGDFFVLMAKITRVCEVSDSMNHVVWNKDSEALKMKSIIKNVRKSKMELTGPRHSMNRLMKCMSHRLGFSMYSWSTSSVGIVDCEKS